MRLKIALMLLLAFVTQAVAQSNYTTMNWGLDRTVSPYNFGASIGGTWRNLGTVSSLGVWAIPGSNLSFTPSGAGAVTRDFTTKLREVEVSLEDYLAGGETTYDNAMARALAAYPTSLRIALKPGTTYNFASTVTLSRSSVTIRCKGYRQCVINFAHAGTGFAVNDGTTVTTNITTTNGSQTATVASAAGLAIGQNVSAAGVPSGTTISNIVGTTVTLSAAATGSATVSGVFGTKIYNIEFDGMTFTRSVLGTTGCDIKARNMGLMNISNIRFYSNSNSISAICGTSVSYIQLSNLLIQNMNGPAVIFDGASSAGSSFEGVTISVHMDKVEVEHAQQTAVNGVTNNLGAIQIGDYSSGVFIRRPMVSFSQAYGISLKGTVTPSGATNNLIFIEDANVESDTPSGGGISVINFGNVDITHGWVSGYAGPAVNVGSNASSVAVTGMNLAVNGSATYALACAAPTLSVTGSNFVAYNGSQNAFGIYPNCSVIVTGGTIYQFATAFQDVGGASAANARIVITGMNTTNTTTFLSAAIATWSSLNYCNVSNNSSNLGCVIGFLSNSGTSYFAGAATFAGGWKVSNTAVSATAPTIGSGFGTTPSIVASNGTAAFQVNVGTGGTASSGVITMPAATNGWSCNVTDVTTASSTVFLTRQTASTTTSVTVTNFDAAGAAAAWTASDKLNFNCVAF